MRRLAATDGARAVPPMLGALAGATGQASILIGSLLANVVVARASSATEVGTFAAGFALVSLTVSTLGLQLGAQATRAENEATRLRLFGWLWIAVILGAGASFVLGLAALLAGNPRLAAALFILTVYGACQPIIDVGIARIVVGGHPFTLAFIQLGRASLRVFTATAFAVGLQEMSAWQIALIDATVSLGTSLLILLSARSRPRILPKQRVALKVVLRGGVTMTVAAVTWLAIVRMDVLALSYFDEGDLAGRYVTNLRMIDATQALYVGLMAFTLPALVSAASVGKTCMMERFSSSGALSALVILPAFGIIGLNGVALTDYLFGDRYFIPGGALLLISIAACIQVCAGPNTVVLMALHRDRDIVASGLCCLAITAVANLYLVPRHGVYGAAISTLIGIGTLNALYTWRMLLETGNARTYFKFASWTSAYASVLFIAGSILRRMQLDLTLSILCWSVTYAMIGSIAAWTQKDVRQEVRRMTSRRAIG